MPAKGTGVFQGHEDINVIVAIALSSTKPVSNLLKFNFQPRYLGKRSLCP